MIAWSRGAGAPERTDTNLAPVAGALAAPNDDDATPGVST